MDPFLKMIFFDSQEEDAFEADLIAFFEGPGRPKLTDAQKDELYRLAYAAERRLKNKSGQAGGETCSYNTTNPL